MEPITIYPVPTPPKKPYVAPWSEQLVTYTKLSVALIVISSALAGYCIAMAVVS